MLVGYEELKGSILLFVNFFGSGSFIGFILIASGLLNRHTEDSLADC